jgi:hypothetical protein
MKQPARIRILSVEVRLRSYNLTGCEHNAYNNSVRALGVVSAPLFPNLVSVAHDVNRLSAGGGNSAEAER